MARYDDLTLAEVLADPLILRVARADGWSKAEFKDEMVWASQELHRAKTGRDLNFAPTVNAPQAAAQRTCCA